MPPPDLSPAEIPQNELIAKLAQLERERDQLAANLPAHSTPPALIMRLEDLEDAIAALRDRLASLPADPDGA
jgi:hypothetical protein